MDGLQHRLGVLADAFGFQMHGDQVSPRRSKVLGVEGRVLDHQVHVVKGVGQSLVQALEHRGAIADVGHKVTIHHVNVQHVRTGVQGGPALCGQIGQVGRKDRHTQFCLHGKIPFPLYSFPRGHPRAYSYMFYCTVTQPKNQILIPFSHRKKQAAAP